MGFGFSPKHIDNLQLEDLQNEHFLVMAIDTALMLGWKINFVNESGFIARTKISMSSWGEEFTVKIDNGVASIKSECKGSQMVDWGKNRKNIEKFISQFRQVKDSITQEELETKLAELRLQYPSEENDILMQAPLTGRENITGLLSVFKPTKGYFITPVLLILNVLIFAIMAMAGVNIFEPDNESLLNWGANFRPMTLEGEYWRVFTSCFIHIGIFHLLMNMYALVYIGILLERYLGKSRFIAAYLLTGISASVASLWWNDFTISAGASGAIFGMYGVFLAFLTTNLVDKSMRSDLLTSILIFIGYNLVFGLKGNIDNAAHIGGLISGFVMGYALVPSVNNFKSVIIKVSTIAILSVLVIGASFTVFKILPNDIVKYESAMDRFAVMESMAVDVFTLPENTPREELLAEIKNRGINNWNESILIIDSLEKLELPSEIKERNIKLKTYCELRIKSYELIYKAIEEDTDLYDAKIEEYNQKIEKIISEMNGSE